MKLNLVYMLLASIAQCFVVPFEYDLQSLLSTDILLDIDLSDYTFSTSTLSERTIKELFSLHKTLVTIPSVSENEAAVALKLSSFLKSKGLTVKLQKVSENRFNVIAYKGFQNDTKVLVTSHIDTVPPYFPYSLNENGSKIYGRGSTDAKGSVSTQVIAFLELFDDLKDGDVSLLFDVGEENGGAGFKFADDNLDYHWNTVIFGEPTELKLGVGHKGVYSGNVEVIGKASHSGYPELGIDANSILIDFLYKLKRQEFPIDKLLGPSSLNIGLIEGGVASNVVSPNAKATLAFRVANSVGSFLPIIERTINDTIGGEHIRFIEAPFSFEPVYFDHEVDGFESIVLGYGTDAFLLKKKKVEHKLLYGPGSIHVAHGAEEFVDTDDLIKAVEGYKKLILHALY